MHRFAAPLIAAAAATALAVGLFGGAGPVAAAPPPGWELPVADATVVAPFRAPAHRYGPGHRGVDLAPASADAVVTASAGGVIAFSGRVVDRGVVTIDHGGGWVTTVEPVEPTAAKGDVVVAGDPIALLGTGGHAPAGILHVGVRHDGEYVNPLSLVREIPRAILLPCC
ncbi:murein hydrolase activator EnvC [Microbacterium sp. 179-B 1A2 NHS]|uniref:murein hydrolase activator EnvC family protein n=1 Tax=Microbacterium sp. 179-B 1A2 NHS TaxID=3142383 RepID=UPI0039A09106